MLVALLPVAVLGANAAGTQGPESTWRARAELAKRRLAAGGLDACDQAVEQAFQASKPETSGGNTMYPLDVEVGGRKLLLAYNYQGGQLDSFAFLAIPSSWVAYQKVDSKTVRFVHAESKCAFSLCTSGPTSDGACAEKGKP